MCRVFSVCGTVRRKFSKWLLCLALQIISFQKRSKRRRRLKCLYEMCWGTQTHKLVNWELVLERSRTQCGTCIELGLRDSVIGSIRCGGDIMSVYTVIQCCTIVCAPLLPNGMIATTIPTEYIPCLSFNLRTLNSRSSLVSRRHSLVFTLVCRCFCRWLSSFFILIFSFNI